MNKFMIIFLFILFLYCLKKKCNIFELYIEGVKNTLNIAIPIFTCMMAFLLFINLLKTCGILTLLDNLSYYIKIPADLIIMGLLRPISANASLSYLYTIYNTYGADHLYSLFATLIQSGSDTTFYVITLYFSSIKHNDYQYALFLGLFMDLLSFFFAFLIFLKMIV